MLCPFDDVQNEFTFSYCTENWEPVWSQELLHLKISVFRHRITPFHLHYHAISCGDHLSGNCRLTIGIEYKVQLQELAHGITQVFQYNAMVEKKEYLEDLRVPKSH